MWQGCYRIEEMSKVEEIEQAILDLNPEEFIQIARRVHEIEQERWDHELDEDASSGRLDFLRDDVSTERSNKTVKDWPPAT